jgi:hypothetical protein
MRIVFKNPLRQIDHNNAFATALSMPDDATFMFANNDLGGFDSALALTYAYESDSVNNPYYYGFQLLSHPVAGHSIWYNGTDDQYVRSTANLTTWSSAPESPGDLRNQINAGPFDLAAGDSFKVFYAMLAADNLNELMTVATTVKNIFTKTDIKDEYQPIVPAKFALYQNYPNPFNPITKIRYGLPKECDVKLAVFDIHGELVRWIVVKNQQPGYYEVIWDGRNNAGQMVASGIYLYRIQAATYVKTQKMVLLK